MYNNSYNNSYKDYEGTRNQKKIVTKDDFTRLFLNGNLVDTYTGSYTLFNNETEFVGIGYRRNNGINAQNNFNAYWSLARITNGIGRYSQNFNPLTDSFCIPKIV